MFRGTKWNKIGQIFSPKDYSDWGYTHGAYPTAVKALNTGDSIFTVYFSCRDQSNRSHIARILLNMDDFSLLGTPEIVLEPGIIGAFDDSGVTNACIVTVGKKEYLYYIGWNLAVTVPWRNSIGLAIKSENSIKFERYSLAPIIDRSSIDPYSLSYPWVMREENVWKMWYGSNLEWGASKEDMLHVIKYAESSNGIDWERQGHIAIAPENLGERAFSRPCIIQDRYLNLYRMWYSYRGNSYRIGYAESVDGLNWARLDEISGINVSSKGWDSDEIEYPYVFQYADEYYMLFNGNQYGKTGFGIAVLQE